MRRSLRPLVSFLFLAIASAPLSAQTPATQPNADASRFDLSLGYNNIRANAPPANCGCFNMNGGFASANFPVWSRLSAAVEVTGGHTDNIGPLGQNLTLTTYTAGPRFTFRHHHVAPFAQALFGAAHGSDSYFPQNGNYSTNATSFAVTAGGGVDYNLTHRVALRLVEAQYLHTTFPNGLNNSQQHLMLGAGIVFGFGKQHRIMSSEQPPPPRASPTPEGDSERPIPLPPTAPPPVPATSPVPAPTAKSEPAPTINLPLALPSPEITEILFDYDSAELRPDARSSIARAKALLDSHPESTMTLAGHTDARGSAKYDSALGQRRARRVRQALVLQGIRAHRLTVVSQGKGGQVCTDDRESCWQRNRRVTLILQP